MKISNLNTIKMLSFIAAIGSAILLLSCSQETEGVIYVDNTNPNSSDLNLGTESRPLRTIQAAVNIAGPGTTIYVREGVYNETVLIDYKSGTADAMIVIKPYNNEHVVVQATSYACFNLAHSEYIEISGFELTGAVFTDLTAHGGGIRGFPPQEIEGEFGARHCLFSNNIVHDNNAGIWLTMCDNNLVMNNIVYNSQEAPIRLKHSPNNEVYNNLTYDNGTTEQWGICYYASPYTIIRHNTSVEEKGGSIYLYEGTSNLNGAEPGTPEFAVPCSDCEIYDNVGVVYGDGAPLVLGYSSLTDRDSILEQLYGPLNNYYQYNLFYHPGEPDVIVSWGDLNPPITWWTSPLPAPIFLTLAQFQQMYPGYGDNSIVADPLFVDPANNDFRLQSGSPAVGMASDGTDLGVDFDELPSLP